MGVREPEGNSTGVRRTAHRNQKRLLMRLYQIYLNALLSSKGKCCVFHCYRTGEST